MTTSPPNERSYGRSLLGQFIFSRKVAVKLSFATSFLVFSFLLTVPLRVTFFILLFSFYCVGYWIFHRKRIFVSGFDWIVFLLLGCYLLSQIPIFIMDGMRFRYFGGPVNMLFSLPIYMVFKDVFDEYYCLKARKYVEYGLILGCVGSFLLAVYQTQYLAMPRADGFLFSINYGYLSCALAFLAFTFVGGSRRKYLLAFSGLLGVGAVLLTLTRGAIVAVPVLAFLLIILNIRRLGVKRVLVLIISIFLLFLLAFIASDSIQKRVAFTLSEVEHISQGNIEAARSSGARLYMWLAAIEAFKQRPLVGLTYGERESLNKQLYADGKNIKEVAESRRGHAHSQYFELLATGGVLGIFSLVGFLFVPAIYFSIIFNKNRDNVYALAGLTFCSGFIIYGLSEVALQQEMINAFYAYVSVLMLALSSVYEKNSKEIQ